MTLTIILLTVALVGTTAGWIVTDLRRRRARREIQRLRRALERRDSATAQRPAARAMRAFVGTALDTAVRMRDEGISGVVKSSFEGLTKWSQEDASKLARLAGDDGRVAILFSDIEESTLLNDQLGDAQWVKVLASHNKLIEDAVTAHGGRIIKSQGDGFMIAFGSAPEAVRAALALQTAIDTGDRRLRRQPIRVRIGVHYGKAIEKNGDLFGRDVALAARVASEAVGGEILASDAVQIEVVDLPDVRLIEAQTVELKGLPGTHRLWSVEPAA